MLPFIRSGEDWAMVAAAVATSLAAHNIVYAEASISPTDFRQHGLGVAEIAANVRRGLASRDLGRRAACRDAELDGGLVRFDLGLAEEGRQDRGRG